MEDNPKLAGTLEEALGQAGFTVDCVHDGHAADLLLTTQDYALLLLDLGLPGSTGSKCCAACACAAIRCR